jgi:hypothetical protein
MTITVTPARPGMFEARLGDRLLCTSRQPFFDAARGLVAEGVDPGAMATMRHAGSDTDCLACKARRCRRADCQRGRSEVQEVGAV